MKTLLLLLCAISAFAQSDISDAVVRRSFKAGAATTPYRTNLSD